MTRCIRIGVIGTGLATRLLHLPVLHQMPDRFAIEAFANDTRAPAEKFAELAGLTMHGYFADYQDLLRRSDIEAVLVAVPIPNLYAIARDTLEAGKHLLCEKPLGVDLAQARAFGELAIRFPDQRILIAENRFYRDDLRLARQLLDSDAIGQIHLMRWHQVAHLVPRDGDYSSTAWRQKPVYRGGPHLDAGVHDMAQIRLLRGNVRTVQAFINDANPTMGGPSDLTMNLRFTDSAIGNYLAAYLPFPSPDEANEMRLYGTEGTLIVRRGRLRLTRLDGLEETYTVESDNGYFNEWLNFHDAIAHGDAITGTVGQSFHNFAIVMAAIDSAEQNRIIDVVEPFDSVSRSKVPLWRPRGASGLFDGLPCQISRTTG